MVSKSIPHSIAEIGTPWVYFSPKPWLWLRKLEAWRAHLHAHNVWTISSYSKWSCIALRHHSIQRKGYYCMVSVVAKHWVYDMEASKLHQWDISVASSMLVVSITQSPLRSSIVPHKFTWNADTMIYLIWAFWECAGLRPFSCYRALIHIPLRSFSCFRALIHIPLIVMKVMSFLDLKCLWIWMQSLFVKPTVNFLQRKDASPRYTLFLLLFTLRLVCVRMLGQSMQNLWQRICLLPACSHVFILILQLPTLKYIQKKAFLQASTVLWRAMKDLWPVEMFSHSVYMYDQCNTTFFFVFFIVENMLELCNINSDMFTLSSADRWHICYFLSPLFSLRESM